MAKKAFSKEKKGVKAQSIKKKGTSSAKSTEVVYHSTKEIKVERALIENFIGLQKVMINLSNKFDSLSSQISKLLDLFEISAKSLARKELAQPGNEGVEARKILDRLDNISKQAGLIGRGLALIHEVGTENKNPVIPLNINRNKMTPNQSIALSKPFPTSSVQKANNESSNPVIPINTNAVEDNSGNSSMPAKKMTRELEAESLENSSSNNSGMP